MLGRIVLGAGRVLGVLRSLRVLGVLGVLRLLLGAGRVLLRGVSRGGAISRVLRLLLGAVRLS